MGALALAPALRLAHRASPSLPEDPEDPAEAAALDELAKGFHRGESAPSAAPAALAPAAARSGLDASLDASDDELRNTVLARKLARRRGFGLPGREPQVRPRLSTWALAAVAALSVWSLLGLAPEARYWLSAAAARDIGRLGAYATLDPLPDGVYVRAQGVASPRRGSYSRFLSQHEVFTLIGSRLLIDRRNAPDDSLRGYGFQYSGAGRLSRAGARYQGIRDQFTELGELPRTGEVWVLEDSVVPRRGLRLPLEASLWLVLLAGSLFFAGRRLLRR